MNSNPRYRFWTTIDIEFDNVTFTVNNNGRKELFSVWYNKIAQFFNSKLWKKSSIFPTRKTIYVRKKSTNNQLRASNYVYSKDRLNRSGSLSTLGRTCISPRSAWCPWVSAKWVRDVVRLLSNRSPWDAAKAAVSRFHRSARWAAKMKINGINPIVPY